MRIKSSQGEEGAELLHMPGVCTKVVKKLQDMDVGSATANK